MSGHCVGLVGSWRCDDGPFGGHYTISPSYSDDWTPETNRDSLLLCTVARPGARHKNDGLAALWFIVSWKACLVREGRGRQQTLRPSSGCVERTRQGLRSRWAAYRWMFLVEVGPGHVFHLDCDNPTRCRRWAPASWQHCGRMREDAHDMLMPGRCSAPAMTDPVAIGLQSLHLDFSVTIGRLEESSIVDKDLRAFVNADRAERSTNTSSNIAVHGFLMAFCRPGFQDSTFTVHFGFMADSCGISCAGTSFGWTPRRTAVHDQAS